jgi:hypothetical protein
MMLLVTFPTARFNQLWQEGQVGPKLQQIIEDTKPEAIYFGKGAGGQRGAVVIVDAPTPADLARVSEPWYLTFEAAIETSICMTAEDVAKIDMKSLTEKYT